MPELNGDEYAVAQLMYERLTTSNSFGDELDRALIKNEIGDLIADFGLDTKAVKVLIGMERLGCFESRKGRYILQETYLD